MEKISKELKALHELRTKIDILFTQQDLYGALLDIIEKEVKALEIIKKKGVAVGFIQMLQKDNLGGVNEYNDYVCDPKLHLTKYEYDLLKEVL